MSRESPYLSPQIVPGQHRVSSKVNALLLRWTLSKVFWYCKSQFRVSSSSTFGRILAYPEFWPGIDF